MTWPMLRSGNAEVIVLGLECELIVVLSAVGSALILTRSIPSSVTFGWGQVLIVATRYRWQNLQMTRWLFHPMHHVEVKLAPVLYLHAVS